MKTKEQIISDMCLTLRHDFGLPKEKDPGGYSFPYLSGMTEEERNLLWKDMEKIYRHVIAPHLGEVYNEAYFQGLEDSISTLKYLTERQRERPNGKQTF